ncbi:hypothetical protein C922_03131 [Plasmodium inui San Antonio 1]|uniref:Uncharacterized protein n=1 Tax=Plasmodium inui San Antonio 1 TaxID=1237626 RepID=W6ZZZ1_9APIC|nr:hypothetical protein C922_03131 [Plasmodium inui San Antonio 1]EUD66497.1 hypothetical protein C922_03131 [Plasmodium inui San Antonio 1]
MAIGKVLTERACTKKWSHIYVEKEIHTRVNDLLNRIVYGRNKGVCLQGRREPHCTDRVRSPEDSNVKATSKWKCYDKIAVDLLKEYVREFHRRKKNCRFIICQGEKLPNEGKTVEGKQQRVKDTSDCANGRSVDKDGDVPMVQLTKHTNTSSLGKEQPEQPSKHPPDNNSSSRMNTTVNLNHLQYLWLKHTMLIFELLIGSNLRVEEKRNSQMTTTVLALLKRTLKAMPRDCPENGSARVDTLLSWAYLLSKVNMVDKELIIQMCHFFQNHLKTLTSINKFYLLSCMSSFHFLSKRFLRVGNYLQGYFYNLLKMELEGHHLQEGGVNVRVHRHAEHSEEGRKRTHAAARFVNGTDEPAARAANTAATTPAPHPSFCASEVCQVLFKQKKHLTHLDRTILKNVLNGEVAKYGKVTSPFFKFIVKLGDRDLQRFLFDRIIEHVELYEQGELNSVLGSFVKREGLGKKQQGELANGEIHQAGEQDEEFSTLVHILLEADLHSMNLKHVSYLYVYINRLLKKELRRTACWRKGKAKDEGDWVGRVATQEGGAQTSYSQNGYTGREQEGDINPFHPFEKILEGEDAHGGGGLPDGAPHGGNIPLMNQVNEKIILTLTEKMYYIKMNNIVTLLYNTCPIISPKQVAFLEVCFAHLMEEKYLTFNLAKVYRSVYHHFVHSGMDKSEKCQIYVSRAKCFKRSSIANAEDRSSTLAVTSQHEQKVEKIFRYLKERYYLKREQDLGDISTCTILLNVCHKFLLDMLVYSFHRSQGWGHSEWNEQSPGQERSPGDDQLRCSGAAAVLDLVQHIYTHLHFVIVTTQGGLEGRGVKEDSDGDGYDDGDHCDGDGYYDGDHFDGDRYDDGEERRPLRRKQFQLALLYGRNIVSDMGVYVDAVERAFRFWGSGENALRVGHLNTAPNRLNQIDRSGGNDMPKEITLNADPLCSFHDLQNDPIDVQKVRHLMHYVSYVCTSICERMGTVEGEKTSKRMLCRGG